MKMHVFNEYIFLFINLLSVLGHLLGSLFWGVVVVVMPWGDVAAVVDPH
jgi:hypothetical protein